MPRNSKRFIAMKDLSEAVVSHCIYSNAKILLLEESESEYDSEDDDALTDRVTVTAHYAVCNMSRYLFREEYYRPNIMIKGEGGCFAPLAQNSYWTKVQ